MNVWDLDIRIGDLALDFSWLGALLIAGFLCRRFIPFFQRYLIPAALIAGFLGLTLGPELLNLVAIDTLRMGVYLYHLLALTFIGIGLAGTDGQGSRGALHVGFMFILSYLVQVLIGLGVTLLLMYLLNPDLVPAIGMLLPLGFGMGPGIAYSIGQSWEAYGFNEGASIGLTIAAIGFLVAYFSGMVIVNRGIRAGRSRLVSQTHALRTDVRTGVLDEEPLPPAGLIRFHSGAIESLSFHLGLIGLVYLATYVVTAGIEWVMRSTGIEKEIATLWSFHFIIANLLALATRKLMNRFDIGAWIDPGLTHRLTGLFTDYLITAAIVAISLSITWTYILPVLIMCALGALVTGLTLHLVAPRVFEDYPFERFVGVYGEMTGTISSGLALVRVTDPEFKTPIAQDLGLGSGVALMFGFPLLLVINMPFYLFDGQLHGYWIVMGICILYLTIILVLWKRLGFRWHEKTSLSPESPPQ